MPAASYHIVDDYLPVRPRDAQERQLVADELTLNAYCIVAVVRLALPVSFSRKKMSSITTDPSEGARKRGDTLVIASDVRSCSVSGSKGSHLKAMSAQLHSGLINYQAEVQPGDWVLTWMVQSEDKAHSLLKRIADGKPCNEWDDGLKFVGKVTSMRKRRTKNRQSGTITIGYNLAAAAFTPLDASVFFDPLLAEKSATMGSWLAKLGGNIKDLLANNTGKLPAALDINKTIPYFMEMLVGSGIASRAANPGGDPHLQIATGLGASSGPKSTEAPFAYLVPEDVGKLLGKASRSKKGGILAYADLVELHYGVQKYVNSSTSAPQSSVYNVFIPDGLDSAANKDHNQKFTGKPMMGQFIPTIPDFSNKTVWSILTQWLNPVINEMYTTMKVNPDGKVVPTLVLRQLPFTSDVMAERLANTTTASGEFGTSNSNTLVTTYLELPRWQLHPVLVYDDDTGRSDATRFNFIHVYGQAAIGQKNNSLTFQLVRNPPIRDDIDIQRHGLRPYMTVVACSLEETREGPRTWMEIASDYLMGQHLTMNGTLSCAGIQAPICEGDNVEWGGVVYHIEQISHQFSYNSDSGMRLFDTTLQVSHGMRSDNDAQYQPKDIPMYAYMYDEDGTGLDAKQSVESFQVGSLSSDDYALKNSTSFHEERRLRELDDAKNLQDILDAGKEVL